MANARRVEQVNTLAREVIAEILVREFSFPDLTLVTVTRVDTSEDLYYATVYISVLGGDETAVLERLKQETGAVQHRLNRTLRMRPVPRITFAIDEEEKRRERIEKLLSEDAKPIESDE